MLLQTKGTILKDIEEELKDRLKKNYGIDVKTKVFP